MPTFSFCWISAHGMLTLYPIETPFDAFANRADPDQAELPNQGLLCLLMEI